MAWPMRATMTLREFVDMLRAEGVDVVEEEIRGTLLLARLARRGEKLASLPMVDGGENIEWSTVRSIGRQLGFPDEWPLKPLK